MAVVKILLVEDENIEALDIKNNLESSGYEVPYVASNSEEALEKALEIMPDIILMGINLKGGIDSFDFSSMKKKINLPIIFLIAHSEISTIELDKIIGPYDYLLKPYDSSKLRSAIELVINKNNTEIKRREIFKTLNGNNVAKTIINEKRAVSEVQNENDKLWALINSIPDEVWFADNEKKFTLANPSALREFGLTSTGINIEDMATNFKVYRPDGSIRPIEEAPPLRALNGELIKNNEEIIFTPNKKEWRYRQVSASPVKDINNNISGSVTVVRDITEYKKAEEELRKSEKRYHNLFNNMLEGFALCKMIYDENGRPSDWIYQEVNTTFERLTGLKNIVDKRVTEVIPGVKESDPKLFEIFGRVALTGKPETFEYYLNPLKIWFRISVYSSEKEYFIKVFENITDRKQAEEKLSSYKEQLEKLVDLRTAELVETHKALKESEGNFRALAENLIDSILIAVENGKHVYVNPKAAELTGYSKEELLNTNIEDIAHPEEIIKLKKRYALRIAEKHIPSTYETRIVRKDNKIVPIELSAARTMWKDQPAVMVQVSDITTRKKIEEKLKLASSYNRSLIEASLDPLVTIGPDGKVTDVNNATEKSTGYSRDEIIGSDFSNYFTEPEKAKKGYKKVFQEGFVKDYPLEIQHRNGHKTPVLYNAAIYKNETGKVVGVFAAARDITQIIEAEKNIQMLANVVESTDDAIITKSLDSIILSWNKGAEQIYGYTSEEIMGKNISILSPDHLKQEIKNLVENIKQGQKLVHYETLRLKKNGQQINVSITLSPVYDTSGNLIAISTIARDISKEKKSEEKLKKSLKDKEVLLREIHHRVKNNLQIIASLLNLQKCSDHQGSDQVLKESMGRVKTMATIHEKLYESPSLSEINFKKFTEKLVYDILNSYGIPNNLIKTNLIIDDINLNIDTAMPLGLIINELITNSVKYAFPNQKGTINIKLNSLNDYLELTISDDGIGLPKELNMENINTLGLELVKNLVNQLEGNLKLNRNDGTEYKIRFREIKYKKRL